MTTIFFEIMGNGAELYIGKISKSVLANLVAYAEKQAKSVEDIWYRNDKVLYSISGFNTFSEIVDFGGFVGPIFKDHGSIEVILKNLKIFVDDKQVHADYESFSRHYYSAKAIPEINDDEVVVTHGLWDMGRHSYNVDNADSFDESKLTFSFYNCGGFYILTYLEYDGKAVQYNRKTIPQDPIPLSYFR